MSTSNFNSSALYYNTSFIIQRHVLPIISRQHHSLSLIESSQLLRSIDSRVSINSLGHKYILALEQRPVRHIVEKALIEALTDSAVKVVTSSKSYDLYKLILSDCLAP